METTSKTDRNPSVNDDIEEAVEDSFKDPINQPQRTLKVVVIGAGASGLLLAYKVQRHFDDFHLQVFEKNPAVSGVWSQDVRALFGFKLFTREHKSLIERRRIQDVPAIALLIEASA
jgi:ribulose 1,5-bisphosphate synthetase/thiazole synthase